MMLLKIVALVLVVHSSVQANSREERIQSRLDVVEINDYKYNIDIDKMIRLDSRYSAPEDIDGDKDVTLMRMTNMHGQSYECSLPQFEDLPNDNDGNSEAEKDKEKNSYNFTLINEKVKKSTGGLAKSNLCIFRSLGWWTYEFCFGSHVSQYHLMNNGSIEGEIISLGNFTSDYNWLKANESNFPISSGILFHEQYYELGTICELTGNPRRVIAKIFCDDQQTTEIDLISEVETCIYEIHINSNSLCSIPYFSKKQNKFDIRCSPVVDQTTYADYLAKKERAEIERQKRQDYLKKQVEDTFDNLEKTTEKSFPEVEPYKPPTDSEVKTVIDEANNQKIEQPDIVEPDSVINPIVPKEGVNLAAQILKELNLGMEDLQNFNTHLLKKNKALYKQLKEKGDNPEEEEKIGDWLDQIEKSLDTIGSELNKHKITGAEEGQSSPATLGDAGNGRSEEAVSGQEDDLDSSKLIKELGSLADLNEVDLNAEIEKLTNSIGEENKGQKIQIKIIKLDSDGKNFDSDDLNSLLNSMLKENDDIKKFERLTDSYNYVYDPSKDLDMEEDKGEASQTEMNDFLLSKNEHTFITSDNVNVEVWEKNREKREKLDDEQDDLIIY